MRVPLNVLFISDSVAGLKSNKRTYHVLKDFEAFIARERVKLRIEIIYCPGQGIKDFLAELEEATPLQVRGRRDYFVVAVERAD